MKLLVADLILLGWIIVCGGADAVVTGILLYHGKLILGGTDLVSLAVAMTIISIEEYRYWTALRRDSARSRRRGRS